MTVRKSDFYKREARKEPFQVELDNGEVVTFKNPNRLPTHSAFDLATTTDPHEVCQILLGDDFEPFWAEWRDRPMDETDALIDDVMDHYGAGRGKQRNSQR